MCLQKENVAYMLTYAPIDERTAYLPWQSDSVLFVIFIRSMTI